MIAREDSGMKQMNEREACDTLRKAGLTEEQIANLRAFRQRYIEGEQESSALAHKPAIKEGLLKKAIRRLFGS
jgi:hypothetical protein